MPGNFRSEYTANSDLFWAMRGGGGGTWGAITAMTIKVHKPRDECTSNCYQVTTALWQSNFNDDMGVMAQDLSKAYFNWAAQASEYWSGYMTYFPQAAGVYIVVLAEQTFVGAVDDPDAQDIDNHFK